MSGDLIVMAALIGISRALFGPRKQGPVRADPLWTCRSTFTRTGRGREAEKPSEIPAKGWKDIAWRVYDGIQNDRVLLVAAGRHLLCAARVVSGHGGARVALWVVRGRHPRSTSTCASSRAFCPDGALEVIGDQVKRIAVAGQGTLGLTFVGTLALALWGANAGTKAIFDALNIIYKEREKRSFISADAAVAALHPRRHRPRC